MAPVVSDETDRPKPKAMSGCPEPFDRPAGHAAEPPAARVESAQRGRGRVAAAARVFPAIPCRPKKGSLPGREEFPAIAFKFGH
jgi:hypothetical protein